MRTGSRTLMMAALFAVLGCTYMEEPGAAAADEIIVKFAADEPINEKISQAFNDADAEASLVISVNELSEELGVPFVYSRVTSGREIVIEIPTARVYNSIYERLRRSGEVVKLATERRASTNAPNAVDDVVVTLVRGKIDVDGDVDANALGARLVGDERFPVQCEARADGRLALTPDFDQLVKALLKELGQRSDVDYAQANYRARHFDD